MNERIKELAEQAIETIPDHMEFNIPKEFTDKFAELIVRECAKVLWDSNDILGEYRIKKHFGVEE